MLSPPPRLPNPPTVNTRVIVATVVGGICGVALGLGIGRWSANRRWHQRFHISSAQPGEALAPAVISMHVPPAPGRDAYWTSLAQLDPVAGEGAPGLDDRARKWVESIPYWVDRQPIDAA